MRWKDIAPLIESRTEVDCKDRYTNILKKRRRTNDRPVTLIAERRGS